MTEHTSHSKSLTMTHEDTVIRNAQLARELAETRQLLWLVVKAAGGSVSVDLQQLSQHYEIETFAPTHSPGFVIIKARIK